MRRGKKSETRRGKRGRGRKGRGKDGGVGKGGRKQKRKRKSEREMRRKRKEGGENVADVKQKACQNYELTKIKQNNEWKPHVKAAECKLGNENTQELELAKI